MAAYDDREHYIPLRKADLVRLLCQELGPDSAEADEFRQLARLVESTFHFEYHTQLEELKDGYAPFDPDADTKPLTELPAKEKHERLDELINRFVWLLERANFTHLTRQDLEDALKDGTEWGLKIDLDLRIFEKLELFVRGEGTAKRQRRRWRNWWRLEEYEVPVYKRLVIILRMRASPRLPPTIDTRNVFIKVFKDIPKMDLEMMLPGLQVRMSLLDGGKIGGPMVLGLGISGSKLVPALLAGGLLASFGSLTAAGAFIGLATAPIFVGLRSLSGYQNTKRRYQLTLAQSLYFHNLDNNAGVLFRLLDEAEEQENREALLAYYFLWREAGSEGWTPEFLDERVEEFLEKSTGLKVDFEIGDALDKVKRLGMVEEVGEGRLRAAPIQKALEALDYAWDNYFKYNNEAQAGAGELAASES